MNFRPSPLLALFATFLLTNVFVGCTGSPPTAPLVPETGHYSVVVSVEPQAGLVERIGGARVAVSVLVPIGKEPENYQPAPNTVASISRAAVYFRVGFPFEESLLPKLQTVAPKLVVADFRTGLTMRPMELHAHEGSDHNHDHAHENPCADAAGNDVHTWLSTANLKIQAATVLQTLTAIDPQHESEYAANCDKLLQELDTLHEETAARLKPLAGTTVYVFHPAYGYFCDEFGLKQRAIEFEGRTPKARELAEWIESLGTETKPTIFVQPEFNRSAAETISRQSGGHLIEHSPLNRNPITAIRSFAELLEKQLAPVKPAGQ